MDFYEQLSARENDALRRARRISQAEQEAAQRFNQAVSARAETPAPTPAARVRSAPVSRESAVPSAPEHAAPNGLFPTGLWHHSLFSSPDFHLLLPLFFILSGQQSDPLLMLALIYILM